MKNIFLKSYSLERIRRIVLCMVCSFVIAGCYDNDEVGNAFLTTSGELKEKMLAAYIAEHPETFSMFGEALQLTGLSEIFKSYGKYTCFLPDDEAMQAWLQQQGKNTLQECDVKVLDNLVRFHVIDGAEANKLFTKENLPNGTIAVNNMADRSIMTSFKEIAQGYIIVNGKAKIIAIDSICKNGVAHTVNQVLEPVDKTVTEILAAEPRYSIFYEAMVKTGIDQKMQKLRDDQVYSDPGNPENIYIKYFKYTVFVEPNELYQAAGIQSYEDLVNKLNLNDGKQPTDSTSAVYRFVAYHCLPVSRYSGEFYEEPLMTMCPNTLLDITIPDVKPIRQVTAAKSEEAREALNICNDYWPKASKYLNGNIAITNADEAAVNGVVHEISAILNVRDQENSQWNLFQKRLRFDLASLCGGTMNNPLFHFPGNANNENVNMHLPASYLAPQIKIGTEGRVSYTQKKDSYSLYFDYFTVTGWFDVEIQTPPIPAGTWEVRATYGYSNNWGNVQFFFDGSAQGRPVFLGDIWGGTWSGRVSVNMNVTDVGKEADAARTRQMRNNNCMPYPAGVTYYDGGSAYLRQTVPAYLRRVIGTFTFDEMKSHTIRVKSLAESSQWVGDFIEFVPADQVISEDIY